MEGIIGKAPKFWVIWEWKQLPQVHPTRSSADAHFADLIRKREIAQRAAEVDILADVAPGAPKDLTHVRELVLRHQELVLDAIAKQQELDIVLSRIEKIELDQLPGLMMALGLPKIPIMVTPDMACPHFAYQVDIKVEDVVRASIPSESSIAAAKEPNLRQELIERKEAAFDWLRSNNAESLIKNLFTVQVPKGQDKLVKQLETLAKKLKLAFEREQKVHPSTLLKEVRERLEAGASIPFDVFNISTGKRARIANPIIKEKEKNVKNNDEHENIPF